MKKLNIICGFVLTVLLLTACNRNENKVKMRTDTLSSGVARIVVDETLAPIIQQQVDVFEGTYPDATIIPVYTSDREAYTLFNEDSIRLIIGTRELTAYEKEAVTKRRQRLRSQRLAVDGIALIVNKQNTDTLISLDVIKKIMTGEIRTWKDVNPESKLGDIKVVFDSPNSSTARFISDSITNKAPFADHVSAVATDEQKAVDIVTVTPNQQVINYVEQNKNAMGVVGVNWISNPSDSTGLSFTPRINVMSISNDRVGEKGKYYKPYVAYLALNWYPLSRNVYIIITDVQGKLPTGFVNFAVGEKGQRIINKSGLFPATVPTRVVRVHSSMDY